MNTPKVHYAAEWFYLLEGDELAELASDIKANGLHVPITMHKGVVLDGRNRLAACAIAGVKPRLEEWAGDGDPEKWVLSINFHRRHMSTSQRAMVMARCSGHHAAAAKARMSAGGKAAGRGRPQQGKVDSPHPIRGPQARDAAGKEAHVSGKSVSSAAVVLRDGTEEVVRAVDSGRLAVSAAAGLVKLSPEKQRSIVARVVSGNSGEVRPGLVRALVKQEQRSEVAKQIKAEPVPLPKGPFRVIVSDPPWQYDKRAGDPTHRGDLPYPSMTTEEICRLPVPALAHEDCILWLWTTNAFMRDAFNVLDAWGFEEKTILTWVKDRMGLGDWLRGRTEHCIMAIRGKPTVLLTNQTTALEAAGREHSRKPEKFYALVETLCPGSRVEMFARSPREGWWSWGAENGKFQ